jgi:hypothetical protein
LLPDKKSARDTSLQSAGALHHIRSADCPARCIIESLQSALHHRKSLVRVTSHSLKINQALIQQHSVIQGLQSQLVQQRTANQEQCTFNQGLQRQLDAMRREMNSLSDVQE